MSIEGSYNPKKFEDEIYQKWMDNNNFKPLKDNKNKAYTIVIPPPNITGILHMGHILNNSIQDTLIRYKRMQGFNTLWIPGTDHAGIATQNKVEKELLLKGIKKEEIGREKFLDYIWEWKDKHGGIITDQLKKLGSSLDWSREQFTMGNEHQEAVKEAFVRLYNDGLIYKGEYIVNWCPKCLTAIADDEVDHFDRESKIWEVKYKIDNEIGNENDFITIATTRPETILGDSAIAVNPEDKRYKKYIGKYAIVPIVNRKVKIIADSYVSKDFGTGALKITPSHDPNDFKLGKKHNLEFINIFNKNATVNDIHSDYEGLTRDDARIKILIKLKELNQLEATKKLNNSIGCCYRCNTIIESRVSTQWFVKMKPLAEQALKVVQDGEINILPKRWEKVYYNWLNNIHDWCISRQLWWGHQIPAYYCKECGELIVAKETPKKCIKCNGIDFREEQDVLDTWFSSWIWPFSTLGWPNSNKDLDIFYPTATLVTGADILFFWVARMVMAGLYFKKEIPFKDVFLHGIVRDEQGRKMSKSLGNSPDPLDLIEKYGADAIRFSFLYNTSQGGDTFYSEKIIEMGSNFANKIWNASKLVIANTENIHNEKIELDFENLTTIEKYIVTKLQNTIKFVIVDIDNFNLNEAAKKIYDFIWKDFCDWYLEFSKVVFYSKIESVESKQSVSKTMLYVFRNALKLLHPFMPFITEKIYKEITPNTDTLMLEKYPIYNKNYMHNESIKIIETVQEIVRSIRNTRIKYNVELSKKIDAYAIDNKTSITKINLLKQNIIKLCNLNFLNILENKEQLKVESAFLVVEDIEIYLPVSGMVDFKKEKLRLQQEILKIKKDIDFIQNKLNNKNFVERAPEAVVKKEQKKVEDFINQTTKLENQMRSYDNGK